MNHVADAPAAGPGEDCAKIVEFLATDLSDFVTGQVICVDGGMELQPSHPGQEYPD